MRPSACLSLQHGVLGLARLATYTMMRLAPTHQACAVCLLPAAAFASRSVWHVSSCCSQSFPFLCCCHGAWVEPGPICLCVQITDL
jgi:hypothetical protein